MSSLFLSDYWPSAPEHNVVVIPEREKEPDWKTGDRNISVTRNRNRCCNSTKSEAPKSGPSAESPLKQNGGRPVTALCCFTNSTLGFSLTGLVDVQQVRVLLVFDGSALQNGMVVECVSRARTQAARRAVWGPAEGAGAAGAVPAAWRETETPVAELTPALPHREKVKNACFPYRGNYYRLLLAFYHIWERWITLFWHLCKQIFVLFCFFRGLHVHHLPSRARLLPDHEYKLQGSKVTPHTTLLDTRSGSDCISLHRNMLVS